jgi:hypothetical protein
MKQYPHLNFDYQNMFKTVNMFSKYIPLYRTEAFEIIHKASYKNYYVQEFHRMI